MDWPAAIAHARAQHPEVRVDEVGFAAHAERCRARGAQVEHAEGLWLAWAAARGDGAAVRAIERMIVTEAEAAARRLDRTAGFVDELRQALRVRLLVADGGRVRLDDYGGRGPLAAWIGVAALRVALNLRRAAAPTAELLPELVSGEADPALRHLQNLYRAELREALTAALAALPQRSRALLRLCFVDGVKLVELGRLYGVHETTAGRWVQQATAAVADDARRRLIDRLALSPSDADSVVRLVHSNLDLSIARVLA